MSADSQRWTRADLEQFADGELDEARRADLRHSLCCNAALRAELADVQRTDARIREALSLPPRATAKPRRRLRVVRRTAACAAVVMLPAVVWWAGDVGRTGRAVAVHDSDRTQRSTGLLEERTAAAGHVSHDGYHAVRVVWSMPAQPGLRRRADQATETQAGSWTPDPLWAQRQQVLRALRSGRMDIVAGTLCALDGRQRKQLLQFVASRLRSGYAAAKLLDALTPRDQLELCRLAVPESPIRAVWLKRMRALAELPETAAAVRRLIRDWSRPVRPVWMRDDLLRLATDLPQG